MRLLKKFLERVGSQFSFEEEDYIKLNNKRFLISLELEKNIFRKDKLVYAGCFLGKDRNDFQPSSILLKKLESEEKLYRIHVNRDTAWLFVCGRDIFQDNIVKCEGKFERDNYFLVMFNGECLGYGRVWVFQGKLILKNIFDIGDFLRRES